MGRKRTTCKLQIAQFASDTYLLLAYLRQSDEGVSNGYQRLYTQKSEFILLPQDIYKINQSIENLYTVLMVSRCL